MHTKIVKHWLLAARPKTLWAAVAPVLIGTAMAYADGVFHWPSATVALVLSLLIQIGTNFANDYFDYIHGADTEERTGPMRLTQAGLISPQQMKKAFILIFALTFIGGLYLVWRGGWPILLVGLLSILFGILYTGGPFPLGYKGLGDVLVLVFFGPVAVGGTYYVQALQINGIVLLAGLSPGMIATSILVANNLRDIATDRKAGKRTLAVRFGKTFSRLEYLFMLVSAALIPVMLYVYTREHPYAMAAVLTILFSLPTVATVFRESEGVTLNRVLADTGKILLLYSVLFSLGWIL